MCLQCLTSAYSSTLQVWNKELGIHSVQLLNVYHFGAFNTRHYSGIGLTMCMYEQHLEKKFADKLHKSYQNIHAKLHLPFLGTLYYKRN